jgi:hypothetical protein
VRAVRPHGPHPMKDRVGHAAIPKCFFKKKLKKNNNKNKNLFAFALFLLYFGDTYMNFFFL